MSEETYVRTDEHGAMRIGDTRVMLESIVAAFDRGHSNPPGTFPGFEVRLVRDRCGFVLQPGRTEDGVEHLRLHRSAPRPCNHVCRFGHEPAASNHLCGRPVADMYPVGRVLSAGERPQCGNARTEAVGGIRYADEQVARLDQPPVEAPHQRAVALP